MVGASRTFTFVESIVSNMAAIRKLDASVAGLGRPVSHEARGSEQDRFLLLREMHHRLANTLTVLAGVIRHEFAASLSPDVNNSLARCEARIVAFGKLNRALAIAEGDSAVSLHCYVERLCEALSEALLRPLGIRCEVFAGAGEMPAEICERLGLAISELVTNAAKHGFYGRNGGLVRVEIQKADASWVCVVADNGVGMQSAARGAGSKIVEQLVAAMGGTLVRKSGPDGTAVIVTWKG